MVSCLVGLWMRIVPGAVFVAVAVEEYFVEQFHR